MQRSTCLLAFIAIGLLPAAPSWTKTQTPRQERILAGSERMPSVLRSDSRRKPIFVGANRILAKNGKVARRLFPAGVGRLIEKHLDQDPNQGCVELDFFDSGDLRNPAEQSLGRTARESSNVLVGHVTGLVPGFRDERPGTLVRFQTREFLKGHGRSEYFVFFPAGNFRVGDVEICAKSDYYPATPRIGDDLLVLLDRDRVDDETGLVRARSSDVITFHRGRASLPRFFRDVDPGVVGLSQEMLVDRVRSAIRSERVEP